MFMHSRMPVTSAFFFHRTNGGEITLWDIRARKPVEVFRLGGASSSSSASSSHRGLSRNPFGVDDDGDFLYQGCDDLKIRLWSLNPVGAANKRPFAVFDPPPPVVNPITSSSTPTSTGGALLSSSSIPTAASLGSASQWAIPDRDSSDSASNKDWLPRPIFSRRWQSPGQASMPMLITLVRDEIVFYRGLW